MPRKRKALTPAEAAKLLEEMDAKDPCRFWAKKLGPTTLRCAQSTKLYRLVNGGNQVGKTTYAVWECASLLRGIHPWKKSFGKVKILIVVPYRLTAVAVWGKRLLEGSELPGDLGAVPFIPPDEIEKVYWNYSGAGKAPGRIVLKNGSECYFAWSAADATWESIQGIMFDYLFRDEAVGNNRLSGEILMRLAAARDNERKTWAGGILWVGTPTLDNEEYTEYQRRCQEGKADFEEFFIHPWENTSISMKTREAMREAMSEDDAEMRLDGGTSYVDRLKIFRSFSDARHIAREDYVPTDQDNLYIVFDPGIGHPCGILCAAVCPDAPTTIRVVAFFSYKDQPLDYHLRVMGEWAEGRIVEQLIVDPKAFTRESSGKSIVTQIEEKLAIPDPPLRLRQPIARPRNAHWDGITKVREYLDPVPGDITVPARIIINPLGQGCSLLCWQLRDYKGREETKYTGPHGVVKKRDEGPDCLRYLVMMEPRYEPRPPNPKRLVQQAQRAAERQAEESLPEALRQHREQLARAIAHFDKIMGHAALDDGELWPSVQAGEAPGGWN